jgi:2-polyprenyl-3-methyl-5-hydroxy-6-metoxy-1,4-benzoquinol methylase
MRLNHAKSLVLKPIMNFHQLPFSCPVCNSNPLEFCFICKDHSITGEEFKIWECNNCKHRITAPIPPEAEIDKYYKADHYISHTDSSKGVINKLYKLARRFTLSEKRRFIQRQTGLASGRLLEVGTGTGAFLNVMEQSGWQTTGLEPDYQAREKAMLLYKLPLYESSYLFNLLPNTFDAIVLWHVLEHVYTLQEYMQQFAKVLKKDGLLFIAVPNYTSYDAQHYGSLWAAYDVPRHLHHFSPVSMQTLASFNGFRIIRKKPMWLDAFYISLLSEKYKHGRNKFFAGFWQGFVSSIKALPNRTTCSSIIYVLKKE